MEDPEKPPGHLPSINEPQGSVVAPPDHPEAKPEPEAKPADAKPEPDAKPELPSATELKTMTRAELDDLAAEHGIDTTDHATKADVIDTLTKGA
jgi:hypothetical protein